ncbi:long-chain-fatty-acyl-CoA reductase [Sphingobium jiangsuense]|uniref:Long-chain-fatty-acyl-CoA reductase n=1 Tax=Sphingobium jiangsuense TaxID=870476 RepID=A0A7W6BL61_9SPHN|nr:acyl-CoA reductase [Sphingobium jiangsuense]MBB3925750.1 hypothetical protein [Sphingobium jiangsuense]GLT00018.1 long-chain-fatty-acyl-CoA reductase [Sphingobium jiangsuense]
METPTETMPVAPMILRGRIVTDHLVEVGGRGGDLVFRTPDAHRFADLLPLGDPGRLADLYSLSFEDILDYLEALGARLDMATNAHLREACRLSYLTAPTTPPIVDASYAALPAMFARGHVREMAEKTVGIRYLEGWVEEELDGLRLGVRCFGARTLHIIAGNSPMISALTIIRNAILRSDAIIKTPSNDPFTAPAIARTMIDLDPGHPITRHLAVAYWRGGDEAFEERLYQPHNVEKIMAWGGYASVKHVTRYIQPGLELVSLDPKRSASIIGGAAFASEAAMADAARRLATDIGAMNQVGCVNARVVYVQSGTDEEGVERLKRFGEATYRAMLDLPEAVSTRPKRYDRELKGEVDALRLSDDWYSVIGGTDEEGAIIVSHMPDPVDFATRLGDRTANLVPIDDIGEVTAAVDAYTQTVGVYPESLKAELLDVLPLYGAQRFVTLGHAVEATLASAQDGIEPVRRMGKWIINEIRA